MCEAGVGVCGRWWWYVRWELVCEVGGGVCVRWEVVCV